MTTNIGKDDKFLGYPAIKLRDLLKVWERGKRTPNEIAQDKTLGLSANACAAMLSEAHERGFMEFDEYGQIDLSDAGRAVAWASAQKRSSKTAADKVLGAILDNAMKLSKDENAPIEIDQIWLFGSYVNPAKDEIGDLDIAFSTRKRPFAADMSWREINAVIDANYPGLLPESVDPWRQERHWVNRMLFGKRKHPLISATDIDILKDLHQPCRLVYDNSQGGVVAAVDYPHHPDSLQRGSHVRERLHMPDLSTNLAPFEPTSARIQMSARNMATEAPCVIGYDRMSKEDLAKLASAPLDGKGSFAFVVDDTGGRAIFHVTREADLSGDVWQYRMRIDAVQMPKKFDFGHYTARIYAECVGAFFGADVLRLVDRRAAMGLKVLLECDLDMGVNSRNACEFIDLMQNETALLVSDQLACTRLPEEYMHGIEIFWGGESQFGWSEMEESADDMVQISEPCAS
jgi:hypothetical protein